MKNSICSLPIRGRTEVVLSLFLAAAIISALLLPGAGSNLNSSPALAPTFTLVEEDLASPFFSSATEIDTLNGAARQIARFAGYDDFFTRFEWEESVSVVNVTRFCGDLLSILQIDLAVRETDHNNEPFIYISERLWNFAFARRLDILGRTVKVYQTSYRIAGVTRSYSGLLEQTDVWMPINSRSQMATVTSMRILGCLRAGADWKTAQEKLTALSGLSFEKLAVFTGGARLLPVNHRIHFEQEIVSLATLRQADHWQGPGLVHQTAALPFRRGS